MNYCWRTKSQTTTWDGCLNPINNGIYYQTTPWCSSAPLNSFQHPCWVKPTCGRRDHALSVCRRNGDWLEALWGKILGDPKKAHPPENEGMLPKKRDPVKKRTFHLPSIMIFREIIQTEKNVLEDASLGILTHLLRMVSWNGNTIRFGGDWTPLTSALSDNMTGCLERRVHQWNLNADPK